MNAKLFPLAGALLLLGASALPYSARAQSPAAPSETVPERDVDARDPLRPNGVDAKTEADLVAHLQSVEAVRRSERKVALQDPKAWALNRPQRAAKHRQEIAGLWGDVVGSIDAHAELRMNADRMARLNRMLDLAEQKSDNALTSRIHADITRELSRHVMAMQKVRALSGMQ